AYACEIDQTLIRISVMYANFMQSQIEFFHQDSLQPFLLDPVDLVVADLPVGYYPDDEQARKYELKASEGHSYAHYLLIEQSLHYTKPSGFLIMLIPETLFSDEKSTALHTFFHKYAHIIGLIQLDEATFKAKQHRKSILILQKKGNETNDVKQPLLAKLPSFKNTNAMQDIMMKVKYRFKNADSWSLGGLNYMKEIMSITAGSSSLKFKLFAMHEEQVLAKGIVERIGHKHAMFHMTADEKDIQFELPVRGHRAAVGLLLDQLMEQHIIQSYQAIDAVGHRVAHGGEYFKESVLIDQSVLEKIDSLSELAPLHNPANLVGIIAFQEYLPDKPMIAVFDTAFHQTMPEKSYLYSLPYKYYEEYGIRKYGFHGTSHKYVAGKAAEIMHKPLEDLRLITCHLGNGVSVTAIEKGKSIDTTMGFTPLAGLQWEQDLEISTQQ